MATVNLKLEGVCAGGGHGRIRVTLNGVDRGAYSVEIDAVLSQPPEEGDAETFLKMLLKIALTDRTPQQVRTGLLNVNGYTVTV